MSKENVLDLFHASNEEALDVTLGEILPEVVKQISEMVVSEATASIICEILGAVFPRINNIRLGWKQNRLERNIKKSVQQIGQDAFTGTDDMFIVQCSFGSFAEQYCRKNKIKYQLV